MRIKKIHLHQHPLFGTMDIDFTGPDGILNDTIVLAGINGSGKTTLLQTIMEIAANERNSFNGSYLHLDFTRVPVKTYNFFYYNIAKDELDKNLSDDLDRLDEDIRPKIFYMPAEINFGRLKIKTISFSGGYRFDNTIDRETVEDIPSYLATIVNNEVYANPDLPAKRAIDKMCAEINSLFAALEIDAEMVGLNPKGEKLPVFANSAGVVFDINRLSSGEKQLFIRAMSLKMLKANNSIILIDEPEISMHPSWQQKIIEVYRGLGKNNQVIVATHSPHVVSSVKKECIKLLKKDKGHIEIFDYNDINGSYGLPVDVVLKELMELESVRDPRVNKSIADLWDMVHNQNHDCEDFRKHYERLENLLGGEDEDLLLMRIQIARDQVRKEKRDAENKKG
ncbi:MAG: ATP-binding protein [bacterium]|nr:ATP-binding protein [bacterium]